jgi:hypothetical protein
MWGHHIRRIVTAGCQDTPHVRQPTLLQVEYDRSVEYGPSQTLEIPVEDGGHVIYDRFATKWKVENGLPMALHM